MPIESILLNFKVTKTAEGKGLETEQLQGSPSCENQCILCTLTCNVNEKLYNIKPEKWDSVEEASLQWKGLESFNERVDWVKGPVGLHMHSSCYTSLSSKRSLSQAEKNVKKKTGEHHEEELSDQDEPSTEVQSPKMFRSSTDVLHDKMLCVWCMKGAYKNSGRGKKMLLLSTVEAWTRFKLHTIHLEDYALRLRLNTDCIHPRMSNNVWIGNSLPSPLLEPECQQPDATFR